jgi:hypothetical protein
LVILPMSHGLGMWVSFSGFALFMVEQFSYEKDLERALDTVDGLIESEVQQQVVEHFDEGGPQPTPRSRPLSIEETAGVPTGIAPDAFNRLSPAVRSMYPPPNLYGNHDAEHVDNTDVIFH